MNRDPIPDDVAVGDEGPTITVEDVACETFVRYAGASGDFNPLHYDDEYVRESGYDGVFGHGMLVAGIVSRVVTSWFGIKSVSAFDVRFIEKVHPGNTICAFGTVVERRDTADPPVIRVKLVAETDDGTKLATGTASINLEADAR